MSTKIKDLQQATHFQASDVLVLGTGSGVKKMPMSVLLPNTAAAHNQFVRGKTLTDEYSLADIYAMVQARDYHDIFVGDKIKAIVPAIGATNFAGGQTEFLVAEIESHWNYGDSTPLNKGHLLLVPSGILGSAYMNPTNTTEGAYDGSYMDDTVMPAVQTALEAAFGADHVLTAREFLTSVVNTTFATKGVPGGTGAVTFANNWVDRKVRLMTELEVYGGSVFSSSGEDDRAGLSHQIALFRMDHKAVCNRAHWWLSAVAGSTYFCSVYGVGAVTYYSASNVFGVRPRFTIG